MLRGVLVLVFASLLSTSCSDIVSSVSLALPTDTEEMAVYLLPAHLSDMQSRSAPLKALNKNAQKGSIRNPKESDAMYFAFEKSPALRGLTDSGLYALELEFEPLELTGKSSGSESINTDAIQTDAAELTVGLLYANDFSVSGTLKHITHPQRPITAQTLPRRAFTVSIGFAGATVQAEHIRGFMVSARTALKLKRAAIVPVRYGWLKDGAALWYGTTADGDVIPSELWAKSNVLLHKEFPKPSAVIQKYTGKGGRDTIVIHFDKTLPVNLTEEQTQPQFSFQCGTKRISVYRAPELYRLTLDGCLFPDVFFSIKQTHAGALTDAGGQSTPSQQADANGQSTLELRADTDGESDSELLSDEEVEPELLTATDMPQDRDEPLDMAAMVCGVTIEYATPSLMSPITADPGVILDWPQTQWRQPSYELFAWEQFPSVLIFDFADYSVQDAYFKRLSFFAEKKGFAGKLLPDNMLTSLHGFNAHDYRAETLAAFFQKAEAEHFSLNKSELYLRKILFHNGLIVHTNTGIKAGTGAIVSISRQSPAYLRYRFMTHECLHGIYFMEERFRNTVTEAFQQTDPRAVLFLRRYFEVYQSLQYNTDDEYLMQNEFMAYILQQDSGFIQEYYNRIAWFRTMIVAEPALCRYIRKTKSKAFIRAAAQMNAFLYTTFGLKGGRIYLARIENL